MYYFDDLLGCPTIVDLKVQAVLVFPIFDKSLTGWY